MVLTSQDFPPQRQTLQYIRILLRMIMTQPRPIPSILDCQTRLFDLSANALVKFIILKHSRTLAALFNVLVEVHLVGWKYFFRYPIIISHGSRLTRKKAELSLIL
jgi:hypothetical protein